MALEDRAREMQHRDRELLTERRRKLVECYDERYRRLCSWLSTLAVEFAMAAKRRNVPRRFWRIPLLDLGDQMDARGRFYWAGVWVEVRKDGDWLWICDGVTMSPKVAPSRYYEVPSVLLDIINKVDKGYYPELVDIFASRLNPPYKLGPSNWQR